MMKFNVFFTVILLTTYMSITVWSAAINTEETDQNFVSNIESTVKASKISKRGVSYCGPLVQCGWGTYDPHAESRMITTFMHNLCECPDNLACVLDIDNVGISSYEFRCREPDDMDYIAPDEDTDYTSYA